MTADKLPRIICPSCGETFELENSAYYEILSQVRDAAFKADLDARVRSVLAGHEIEIKKLMAEHSAEISELRSAGQAEAAQHERELMSVRAECDAQLRIKDEEVKAYRDFKARQSTKMIGESLERYCEDAFNKIRSVAFPGAYFEKDNDVSRTTGSKGDFIFRDFAPDGSELVSIMFEMKNEADTTDARSRHRNADFFKELDKDRTEKKCEYAILVTMLEADSELYNQGIVDVSHRYDKMYVIRPQFFIPVIGFLRNAALRRLDLQAELAATRAEQADILKFESDLDAFKARFGRNHRLASEKLDTAIAEIDKAIKALEKTKASLLSSTDNLRLAGDKLDALTLRKLSAGNETVKAMLGEASGA